MCVFFEEKNETKLREVVFEEIHLADLHLQIGTNRFSGKKRKLNLNSRFTFKITDSILAFKANQMYLNVAVIEHKKRLSAITKLQLCALLVIANPTRPTC